MAGLSFCRPQRVKNCESPVAVLDRGCATREAHSSGHWRCGDQPATLATTKALTTLLVAAVARPAMDGVRCGQEDAKTCAAPREWPPSRADKIKEAATVYNLRNSTYSPKTELSPVSRELVKRRWPRSTTCHSLRCRRSHRSFRRRHELRERERSKQRRSGFKRSVSSVDGSLGAGKSGLKNSYTVKV